MLKPGMQADRSVIRAVDGDFELQAQTEESFYDRQAIDPVKCVRGGVVRPAAPPPGSAGAKAQAPERSRAGAGTLAGRS